MAYGKKGDEQKPRLVAGFVLTQAQFGQIAPLIAKNWVSVTDSQRFALRLDERLTHSTLSLSLDTKTFTGDIVARRGRRSNRPRKLSGKRTVK